MSDETHLTKWQSEFLFAYCTGLAMWGTIYDTTKSVAALWMAFFIWWTLRLHNWYQRP